MDNHVVVENPLNRILVFRDKQNDTPTCVKNPIVICYIPNVVRLSSSSAAASVDDCE